MSIAITENMQNFIGSLQSPNTIKVVNALFQQFNNDDFIEYDSVQLEQFMLDLNPNSPKAIITNCYILGLYAKWLFENGIVTDDSLYQKIQMIDRNLLWQKAKPNAPRKFISHAQYEEVLHDIGVYEEFNSLYYQSLFRCLYEGIYNDDMSVLKNLRGQDIKGNTVTLREDSGHSYDLEISYGLADDLKELSEMDTWERKNRYGVCNIKTKGLHPDSCFKVENRKSDTENSYRFSYYGKLRKISKEYLEYNLLPLQIFVSGIMYRIRMNLETNGITLDDAFSDQNRNRIVGNIISQELERCNNNILVKNFREMVKGHLDIFTQ